MRHFGIRKKNLVSWLNQNQNHRNKRLLHYKSKMGGEWVFWTSFMNSFPHASQAKRFQILINKNFRDPGLDFMSVIVVFYLTSCNMSPWGQEHSTLPWGSGRHRWEHPPWWVNGPHGWLGLICNTHNCHSCKLLKPYSKLWRLIFFQIFTLLHALECNTSIIYHIVHK